jgi:hypothetical protein
MRNAWLSLAVFLAGAGVASAADETPSYTTDIKPFLTRYCMNCHNDAKPKAGYSVETFADLTKSGKRGALVVPEKPDESRLLLSLAGKGKPMPPRKAAQPREEEVGKVRDWIKGGAKDDTPADDDKKKTNGEAGK